MSETTEAERKELGKQLFRAGQASVFGGTQMFPIDPFLLDKFLADARRLSKLEGRIATMLEGRFVGEEMFEGANVREALRSLLDDEYYT